MTLVDDFITLFQGNTTAYGTEEGGAARTDSFDFWEKHVEWHLTGEAPPIGVYPMVPMGETDPFITWHVHWGCVDFDEGEEESWAHAKNVHIALNAYGISSWIERSRSKGYHVWVFASHWVPAPVMRSALLAACQLVEAPEKEINPKQNQLGRDQLGNYVRLPYPGWMNPTTMMPRMDLARRVVVHPEDPRRLLLLSEFVRKALESRVELQPLVSLAAAYTAPERPIRRREWGSAPEYDEDLYTRLRGKALVIFSQGPLEGSGRGHTLYKLACYLQEDGRHTKAEALRLVREADSRWGKFTDRPDGELRMQELVDKAFSR